jgi:hypothetical protein
MLTLLSNNHRVNENLKWGKQPHVSCVLTFNQTKVIIANTVMLYSCFSPNAVNNNYHKNAAGSIHSILILTFSDWALRRWLHFTATGFQPRPDHDPQVAAARLHGPAGQNIVCHCSQNNSSCARRKTESQKLDIIRNSIVWNYAQTLSFIMLLFFCYLSNYVQRALLQLPSYQI